MAISPPVETDEQFEAPSQTPPTPEDVDPPKNTRTRKARNNGGVDEQPQRTLEGEEIIDADLQGLIKTYLEQKDVAAVALKNRNASYDRIKERFPRDLSGHTWHCGPYTITPILTIGGGTREVTVGDRFRVTIGPRK